MNKKLITLAVAGALASPMFAVAADAPASPHSLTGNVGFVTDYLYRGISQTSGKPALQGGFDYAHSSGLYAGIWGSNVNWIADGNPGQNISAGLEIDVYGGYKGAITDDFGFDVGLLTYNYPGRNKTAGGTILKQDTQEVYGALSWKWLTLKYSHSIGALFGWAKTGTAAPNLGKTKGSGYLELNAAYDLGDGWGITGHVGHQKVNGRTSASYSDYKIGVTKDVGFGVVGLAASSTNAKDNCAAAQDYCWGAGGAGAVNYSAGKSTAVLSFAKSF